MKRRAAEGRWVANKKASTSVENDADEGKFCISVENIFAATKRIEPHIVRTSCKRSEKLSKLLGCDIYLKNDYQQATGSFKERGAANAMIKLSEPKKKAGVIAASAGNHALALAYHGKRLGIPVTVVMPELAPTKKVEGCRALGATVIVHGVNFTEATNHGRALAEEKGMTYVHGFNDPAVIAGQGSFGLEVLEQVPDVDVVVIPVGGAGLIAGSAMAIKEQNPNVRIVGVEPLGYASMLYALEHGEAKELDATVTIADGLAVRKVGENCYPLVERYVDEIVTLEEHFIALGVLRLVELENTVVEGAGAAALGAVLGGKIPDLEGKKVVLALCGGNIDVTLLGRLVDHGLAADGRLSRVRCRISDRPGGLGDFAHDCAEMGAGIKEITHDRAFAGDDFSTVLVMAMFELKGMEHKKEVMQKLKALGYNPEEIGFTYGSQ